MSNRKWYEWLLTLTFVAMLLLCIYLVYFSGQGGDIYNMVVSFTMFGLVALILLSCEIYAFFPANRILKELEETTKLIKKDGETANELLFKQYLERGDAIFEDPLLKERYGDFLREYRRVSAMKKAGSRPDVEEYINLSLADPILHRNMLNQVPGALTGLGILGTFIGLSIGLQHFATGSTAEITSSISPLMEGIKVAFHTSIYGMVFSLVFNFVYKRKIEELESGIESFVAAYHKYVLPDSDTDAMSRLIEVGTAQQEAIEKLIGTISESLSEGMRNLMEPQFARFDETLSHFAEGAEKNQLDALGTVVNAFIAEMNKAMNNSFSQLSYTIDQTYLLQKKNSDQLNTILEHAAVQGNKLTEWINAASAQLARLQEATEKMPVDAEKTLALLQEALNRSDAHFREMVSQVSEMTEQVPATLGEAYGNVEQALAATRESVDNFADLVERLEMTSDKGQKGSIFGRK